MLLADYPGSKVQMHYAGVERPDWFCDTIEMFNVYLNPEQARLVTAISCRTWPRPVKSPPQGHWIDAKKVWPCSAPAHGCDGFPPRPRSPTKPTPGLAAENGGRCRASTRSRPTWRSPTAAPSTISPCKQDRHHDESDLDAIPPSRPLELEQIARLIYEARETAARSSPPSARTTKPSCSPAYAAGAVDEHPGYMNTTSPRVSWPIPTRPHARSWASAWEINR